MPSKSSITWILVTAPRLLTLSLAFFVWHKSSFRLCIYLVYKYLMHSNAVPVSSHNCLVFPLEWLASESRKFLNSANLSFLFGSKISLTVSLHLPMCSRPILQVKMVEHSLASRQFSQIQGNFARPTPACHGGHSQQGSKDSQDMGSCPQML